MKRLLSLFLAMLMIASVFFVIPITASATKTEVAQTSETYGDYTYTVLSDGTAKITEYTGSATTLIIPSTLDDYKVTSIGHNAFFFCQNLTEVTIPDSVTSIGDYAFQYCMSLSEVTIPNSVTSIGYGAFEYCTSLIGITIPDSVTSIGDYVFSSCTSLSEIKTDSNNKYYDSRDNCNAIIETATNTLISGCKNTVIPSSVKTIGYGAFSSCTNLTEIAIPSSVESIEAGAFSSCDNLTKVAIPDSVASIGNNAFSWCKNLTEIIVDNNNKYYDSRNDCNAIIETATNTLISGCKNTVIPNSVTSIGNLAFSSRQSLTEITIPDSVTSIGDMAFSNCTSLTEVTIPDSVKSIGYGAFEYCTSLSEVTIPSSVESIEVCAFYFCTNLSEVTIPDSVTSIGASAFEYCYNLTSVTISNSVTSIGAYAFMNCESLGSITIPNGITNIEDYTFANCYSLKSVTIPDSVTNIGASAFYDCYLESVYYLGSASQKDSINISDTHILSYPVWYCDSCYNAQPHTYNNACDIDCNACGSYRTVPDHIYSYDCDYDCNNCGYKRTAKAHSYNWVIDKQETCDESGFKHEECTVCGFKQNENTTIKASGHSFSHSCDYDCNTCGYVRTVTVHSYDGDNDMVCNNCGQPRQTYYITFDLNGGTGTFAQLRKVHGVPIKLPATEPVRSGYKFTGWSIAKDGKVTYTSGDTYLANESVTLYAQWVLQCTVCSGSGKNPHATKCTDCSGNGTKTTKCTICNGKGNLGSEITTSTCSRCDGFGRVTKYNTITCTGCSGSGRYRVCGICGRKLSSTQSSCWFCSYGVTNYVNCSTCNGKGSWQEASGKETCSTCNGTGDVSKYTPINCTICGGRGTRTIDCEPCIDGLIDKTCTICGGTGVDITTPPPTNKPEGTSLKGDVDGDEKITIKDGTLIQKHVANLIVIDEEKFAYADTDKDGKITIKDATRIQIFLAALISEL